MRADCTKGYNFCEFLLAQLVYSGSTKRKGFAPRGAFFSLSFNDNPNRMGEKTVKDRVL